MIGDPLTLEQLRGMDGQPVYLPQTNCWALVTKNPFVSLFTFPDGEQCNAVEWYKTVGPAYTYSPAHIDREALEDCPVCGKYKVITFKGYRKKEEAIDMSGKSHPHISGAASFCPRCGKSIVSGAGAERKEI